jgi:hypothetical protein
VIVNEAARFDNEEHRLVQTDTRQFPADVRVDEPSARRSSREFSISGMGLGGIIALLCAMPVLYWFAAKHVGDPDPFVYAQLAKEVLSGRRLYTEAWQDKPPLVVVAYGLPQLIAPRSYGAIAFFAGMCISLTAAAYAFFFRRTAAAVWGTVLFLSLFPMTYWAYIWPSTETFSNVFVAGNLLLAWEIHRSKRSTIAQCLAVGALTCLAFHVRQNTLFSVLIPALALWQSQEPLPRKIVALAAIAIGAAAAWVAILGLVAWLGDLKMYFWTVFIYPRSFAAVGNSWDMWLLWGRLWLTSLPYIAALFAGLAWSRRRDLWFVMATVAVAVYSVSCPMRDHAHYWVGSFPYVALLIGIAIERMCQLDIRVGWTLASSLAVALVPAIAMQLYIISGLNTFEEFAAIAATVDRLAPPDGTLLVCGRGQSEAIQFASRLSPANTYEWMFQLNEPWAGILPIPVDEITAQYMAKPPDAIVMLADILKAVSVDPELPNLTGDLRLVRTLVKGYEYRIVAEQGSYVVALRVNSQ